MSTSIQTSIRMALFFIVCLLIPAAATAQDAQESESSKGKPKIMELWTAGDKGQRMRIRGRVTSADGSPLANVKIRFRHADADGLDNSYHQGELVTNARGVYQFGSVIPGNSHRLSHVHVYINHPGFQYLETEFYFKEDPKVNPDDPNTIILEEATIDGLKMKYGRWDVSLTPG